MINEGSIANILLALYGLLIGSFLNAWIWRIHTKRSIVHGRSMCPHCKRSLKWYELIPVMSWLALRGKCRTCRAPISWQYPAVEIGTAALWLVLYASINPADLFGWLTLLVWIVIGTLLVAAFVYDAKWMLLPDEFMLPALATSVVWLVTRWLAFDQGQIVLWQIAAAIVFGGFFYLLWKLSGGKLIGDGDIGLAVLMALLLSIGQLVLAVFVAFNLGALVGLSLISLKVKKRSDPIAFGPFLITGLLVGFIWGEALIAAYLRLLI